jgi:hypothetical protein
MNAATNEEIDEAIFAFLRSQSRWQKVAMTVTVAAKSLATKIPEGDRGYEIVHQRILALFEAGKIDGQGDVSQWRHSEVRAVCCDEAA